MTLAKYIKICVYALMLCTGACSETGGAYDDYIISSQEESLIMYEGGTPDYNFTLSPYGELNRRVSIECVNSRWEIISYPDWITSIEPTHGESGYTSLNITASPNSHDARFGNIYIKHIGKSINHILEMECRQQYGYINFYKVTNSTLEVSASKSTQLVELSTNLDDITISSDRDWCVASYDSSNEIISISIQANPEANVRTATITVSSPSTTISESLRIVQAAAAGYIELEGLTNSTLEVSASESTQQVRLRTNLDDITISSAVNWCAASYDPSQKLISLAIQANTEANVRTATITVSSPSTTISESFTIAQAAGSNVNITINPYPNDETIE